MAARSGSYRLGPPSGRLLVMTSRTGIGAQAGHDLVIEATSWTGRVTVDAENPDRSSVTVAVEVASFEVLEGTGGVKPLTDSDRAQIKRNIRAKILHADRHPAINFRSTSVNVSGANVTVGGELTIMGVTRPTTIRGTVSDAGQVRGSAVVVQSRWGIKPYSAFFGALKLADEVAVEVEAQLTPEEDARWPDQS